MASKAPGSSYSALHAVPSNAHEVRTLMRRPATLRKRLDKGGAPGPGAVHPHPALGPDTVARHRAQEVLVRDAFLRQLAREKRRADRSRASLSVVRCELAPESREAAPGTGPRLVDLVNASRRETDIVGHVAEGVVGVLLPDTGEEGAQVFAHKLRERAAGLSVRVAVTTYPDALFDSVASGQAPVDAAALVDERSSASRPAAEDSLKRLLDVVLSLFFIVAFAPIMAVAAIAIAATSRGPVIFRQARLGKGGTPFDFYKFRSMRVSNDDSIHRAFVSELIQGRHADINQQSASEPLFKIKHDPRVTRVGRFIRSTSIDELPQLFNVLKGDMSLVGPRPPLAYEAAQYQSWHLRRILEIRPGITGLWQVEGRSRVSFDDMVRMDLRYIRDRSLALDLKLLVRTVGVVLARQGAK